MEKFEIVYNGITYANITDLHKKLIIDSIVHNFNEHPQYIKTDMLTTSIFRILTSIFVENKKIIFLDAPTGTGKSIIGYMLHYCYYWILKQKNDLGIIDNFVKETTYTLTSSKILQEQLDNDILRFDMSSHFSMLKGMSNYECPEGTKQHKTYIPYTDRVCKGEIKPTIENMECFATCPYMQKRLSASMAPSAVINYAYFLTVMNSKYSPYFRKRNLVIADEGHLVPQIVTSMFSIDLTLFKLNKLIKMYNGIKFNFGQKLGNHLNEIETKLISLNNFYAQKNYDIEQIINHNIGFKIVCELIIQTGTILMQNNGSIDAFNEMYKKDLADINDKYLTIDYNKSQEYLLQLVNRPEDIFIEAQSVGFNMQLIGSNTIPNQEYYKIIIRDLNEAEVTKKYFLSHTNICVFMSATIGDINEFGTLLGLKPEEYTGFSLPSTFNFDKSPIYLTKSGYLNYANFAKNIENVLNDAVKILKEKHPNYGGVVHTSTFQITNQLKELLYRTDKQNFNRYLFYENSEEKDKCIDIIRKSNGKFPYVIIGPSLYEGIDLKNDMGRLNIIVKAPYAGLDNYTKQKIIRFPFFYVRETKEKLQQAIGRTNRNHDDWSITYLLDNALDKLIWQLPNYITNRIKTKKIY